MTRQHRWSPHLMDSKGNITMNPQGPIIDERGKVFRFTANDVRQIYRITNASRPINTRGTTKIDLKVEICRSTFLYASFWVLLGIIEESILQDVYTKDQGSVFLGAFLEGENIGCSNNGSFTRKSITKWTDKFYSGDVVSLIVDGEYGYEEAKKSNWTTPYGRFTCLLNGVESVLRSHTGIFANPEARIYFCTQVDEDSSGEIVIIT